MRVEGTKKSSKLRNNKGTKNTMKKQRRGQKIRLKKNNKEGKCDKMTIKRLKKGNRQQNGQKEIKKRVKNTKRRAKMCRKK